MHFIFGYQIKDNRCGFPLNALNKVINVLEDKKISYEVIGECSKDFKKLNTYKSYLEKSQNKLEINERLDNIINKLENLDSERLYLLLDKFENILYEE